MKILENVPVKSIFHDGKSNRMKIYICISGFFLLWGNGGGVPTHRPKICSSPRPPHPPTTTKFLFPLTK